jgi:8-oxo-dGTP diphosphatase
MGRSVSGPKRRSVGSVSPSVDLSFAAVAEFDLTNPEPRELLAIYRVQLQGVPHLTVNDEVLGFRWWPPSDTVSADMCPLDTEIARRVLRSPAA